MSMQTCDIAKADVHGRMQRDEGVQFVSAQGIRGYQGTSVTQVTRDARYVGPGTLASFTGLAEPQLP